MQSHKSRIKVNQDSTSDPKQLPRKAKFVKGAVGKKRATPTPLSPEQQSESRMSKDSSLPPIMPPKAPTGNQDDANM